jgi:hypothetical protein
MADMNGWRAAETFLVGLSTFIISFILTFVFYMVWLEWRYPGNTAQGDMGAFLLAIMIAPICAVTCAVISFRLTKDKYSN